MAKMPKKVFWRFFLSASLLLSLGLPPLFAQTSSQKTTVSQDSSAQIETGPKVTARVGGWLYDIDGLTSPQAKVELKSTQGNLQLTTYADSAGRFYFQNVLVGVQPGRFCFFATDIDRNPSPPLCLAPPAPAPINHLSGVILPPSLVMDKGFFRQGDRVDARGMSLPNAKIEIFLFKENQAPIFHLLDLVKPSFVLQKITPPKAWAKETAPAKTVSVPPAPKITITANRQGRFSLNLPSVRSGRWRIFAGAFWQGNPTPQSNVLRFVSLSWWPWMLLRFWLAVKTGLRAGLGFLFSWPVLIFFQILIIAAISLKIRTSRHANCQPPDCQPPGLPR